MRQSAAEIIQELSARSGGVWRPSPGSIYPTLQQLEDEGLVRGREEDGKRIFTLTDEGRAEAERRKGEAPWEGAGDGTDERMLELRELGFGVVSAVMQIVHTGTDAQFDRAKEILRDARKQLYRMLAEDDEEQAPPTS